jgi:hypothetical protein
MNAKLAEKENSVNGGLMEKAIVAHATATISAPIAKVWDALVNPETIKQYMFGAEVVSDWNQGSPIAWK